jgi:hypothetical protein
LFLCCHNIVGLIRVSLLKQRLRLQVGDSQEPLPVFEAGHFSRSVRETLNR